MDGVGDGLEAVALADAAAVEDEGVGGGAAALGGVDGSLVNICTIGRLVCIA